MCENSDQSKDFSGTIVEHICKYEFWLSYDMQCKMGANFVWWKDWYEHGAWFVDKIGRKIE